MKPCEKLREHLVLHAAGVLKSREVVGLNLHLAACLECQREFRAMQHLVQTSEKIVDARPLRDRDLRLKEWFLGKTQPRFSPWRRFRPSSGFNPFALFGLGMVAIALIILWTGGPGNPPLKIHSTSSRNRPKTVTVPNAAKVDSFASLGSLREKILSNPEQWEPEFPNGSDSGHAQHYRVGDSYAEAGN
jgi:hypothetical protein